MTFRYRRTGEHKDRTMRLPVMEFLRRFLQHVLPRGFQRIRHYGFLSRRSRIGLDELRSKILAIRIEFDPDLELKPWSVPRLNTAMDKSGPTCPHCGGELIFQRFHRIRPPPWTHWPSSRTTHENLTNTRLPATKSL